MDGIDDRLAAAAHQQRQPYLLGGRAGQAPLEPGLETGREELVGADETALAAEPLTGQRRGALIAEMHAQFGVDHEEGFGTSARIACGSAAGRERLG